MQFLMDKTGLAAQLNTAIMSLASGPDSRLDTMKTMQLLAGVLVETLFLFDEADEAMEASFERLAKMLGCEPAEGPLGFDTVPPAHMMDFETEKGRALARSIFEDWLDCEYEFHSMILYLVHYHFTQWEQEGQHRSESFRLFIECTRGCLELEIASQELCDVVIEQMIARRNWTLGDSISGLAALAGRRLALSLSADFGPFMDALDLPDHLNHVVYVMTQEAARHGIPAGSDWRFGLPANDNGAVNAPFELIRSLDPHCKLLFRMMGTRGLHNQAVACAKAAGRMIAVAAGGENPELEPAIAKPLALAAMTETYRSVCIDQAMVSM